MRARIRPQVLLLLLVAAVLACFAAKPLHIDDPLFVWSARGLARDGLSAYASPLVWFGGPQPMAEVMHNPPLAQLLIALVECTLGSQVLVLHLVFLVPALALLAGSGALASSVGGSAAWALALVATSPAFLVMSTSLMPDVLLAACFTWAVVLWMRAGQSGRRLHFVLALACATLTVLSKYFGLALIPLLLLLSWGSPAYAWRWRLAVALVPVALLASLEVAVARAVGSSPLRGALAATRPAAFKIGTAGTQALVGLCFLGGTLVPGASLLLSRGGRGIVAGICALLAAGAGTWIARSQLAERTSVAGTLVELVLLAATGIAVLAVLPAAGRGLAPRTRRLLSCWIVGTLLFAVFLNWSTTMRAFLPLLPPCAALAARELGSWSRPRRVLAAGVLGLAGALALALCVADYGLAQRGRFAAELLSRRAEECGARAWFQGSWGFAYYAQQVGARPFTNAGARPAPGDWIGIPTYSTNVTGVPADEYELVESPVLGGSGWVTTMSRTGSVGFHSDVLGLLPFGLALGDEPRLWLLVKRR